MDSFSSFALSLDNVTKCINKIRNTKISEFGIRPAHLNCMMHIDLSADGLTPTEISKTCGVDKSFVSRTTTHLIKGGFIQSNKKFDDGRKYKVKYILTEKGQAVISETRAMIENYFSDINQKISEYEMNCFIRVVLTLSESVRKVEANT